MKKLYVTAFCLVFILLLTFVSCKKKELATNATKSTPVFEATFDSTQIQTFFTQHPALQQYQTEVTQLYRKHQFKYIWYDKNGINEFAGVMYNKVNNISEEGVRAKIPYKEKLDALFTSPAETKKPNINTELLCSAIYFFYVDKVFHGIDPEKSKELGWFLPRQKQSYVDYLDSLLIDPKLIHKNEKGAIKQYYLLKNVLEEYRKIEKKGGWKPIPIDSTVASYKPGDSAATIAAIRTRLFITKDISTDSKSAVYDDELAEGILHFKKRSGNLLNKKILPKHIRYMNVPVESRIRTLMINMERCRWISKDITKSKELIVVNIPAYELTFFRDGKPELQSKVVVGKTLNETVIFSAPMKYIVFRPYWNVPQSIIKKEILPAIAKNPNYLKQHNMERKGNLVRQKPGNHNSLGLVKFLFPNSNSIYLHDTPSKGLFSREDRAFSHGCIRVAKPRQLAAAIMKDDPKWNPEKISAAMDAGDEKWYTLKNKIPVYIGYFTAWVDPDGVIHFYEDVYERDEALANLLFDQ
ncbi:MULTISPECIES: murein L,D-transpeptidase [unclassified Flavobacterium]|uniref:L,D-transpeptidase family protein n=1 Tax=unclassified Flavobacterium TaxID=196869 RepID=UPI00131D589C|nr:MULTISPECIES: L,D-transpeptidase family protein [unclassified Flavobacterium]